jgi:hypothetical protein
MFGLAGQIDWVSRLNWGHGMIGKATVAIVVLFCLLGILASRIPSEWAMLAIGAAAVIVLLCYLLFLGYFASNHPELAATEGATYVQTKQLDLAAKGMLLPPPAPVGADPQNPTLLRDSE